MSEPCGTCFPAPAELARLAENAQAGRHEPFVGTGQPDTVLACAHGEVVLGDVLAALEEPAAEENRAVCGAPKKGDGSPCQRAPAPGSDRCSQHPEEGDGDVPEEDGPQPPEPGETEEGGESGAGEPGERDAPPGEGPQP